MKTLALTEGSQFWAAQLEDERFDEEYTKKMAEQKKNGVSARPPLHGYTRLVAAVDELTDHILMLRAESGQWGRPRPRPKPRYPEDRHQDRQIAHSRAKVDDILARAHAMKRGEGVN